MVSVLYDVGEKELQFHFAIVDKVFIKSFLDIIDSQPELRLDVCYMTAGNRTIKINDATSGSILSALDSYQQQHCALTNISIVAQKNVSGVAHKWIHLEATKSGLEVGLMAQYDPDSVSWVEIMSKGIKDIVVERRRIAQIVLSEWSFAICTWLSAIVSLLLAILSLVVGGIHHNGMWVLAGFAAFFFLLSVILFVYQRASKGGSIIVPWEATRYKR